MQEEEQKHQTQPSIPDAQSDSVSLNKNNKLSSRKSKLIVVLASIFSLLMLGFGAAAYNEVVLNNPDRIWDQAINNTTKGFDTISKQLNENSAKGGRVMGSITVTEPIAATGSIEGSWYEKDAEFMSDTSISGVKINNDIRVVGGEEGQKSEIYVKFDGLDSVTSLLDLIQPELSSVVSDINGNWYLLDDSLVKDTLPESEDFQNTTLTPEELTSISEKINNLIKERLLSSDESKSVVVVEKTVGREDFEGRDTYKYVVKIQKQQLTEFITALQEALQGTQLENLIQDGITGENSPVDTMKIDELLSGLNSFDTNTIRAEAWVDMDTKYFRNVRIPITLDDSSNITYIDFGLDYDGGDVFPFSIKISDKTDTEGVSTSLELTASLNKVVNEIILGFSINSNEGEQKISAKANLNLMPSNEPIEVEVPEGAINASELLNMLGRSSLTGSEDGSSNLLFDTMLPSGIEL
jgi:hypothetical protein